MRQAVIFEHDTILFLFEEPVQGRTDRLLTAQIGVPVEGFQAAGPIHSVGNALPNLENLLILAGPPWSGSITSHIEALRAVGSDRLQHPLGGIGSVENQKKQGGLGVLFLVIHNLILILR